jgi:DNA polymerase-3 subunit delta
LVENYKPPIFWKEKNIIKEQLNRWDIKELYLLQNIIFETEMNCKKNYDISLTILQQFIVATSTKNCLENKLY